MTHLASLQRSGSGYGAACQKFPLEAEGTVCPLGQIAAVHSDRAVAVNLPPRLAGLVAVPIDGLPFDSWVSLMPIIIPFSDKVFVAGSTGTWLAEFGLHRQRPRWVPNDIDVFMMQSQPREFAARVAAVAGELARWGDDAWPIRTRVFYKHPHMINIHWWVSGLPSPTLSFINCNSEVESSDDILNGFDIDICRVAVFKEAGEMCVRLHASVRDNIQQRVMHCDLHQGSLLSAIMNPMAISIDRIEKYSARGYRLQKLSFQSEQGGRLRIDRFIRAVSWDVLGQHQVEVDEPAHQLPPPPPIEWQSRGAPHAHMH